MKNSSTGQLKSPRHAKERVLLLKAVYGRSGEFNFPQPLQPPAKIRYVVVHEPPHYVAQCLDVDVSSFGKTIQDAVEQMQDAVKLHFEPLPEVLGVGESELYAKEA